MTDQEITGSNDFRTKKSRLISPKRKPTDLERKKLVGILMDWLVKYILNHFQYTFGRVDKRQSKGGPIGDEATRAIARFVGSEFDEIFLKKIKKNCIKI